MRIEGEARVLGAEGDADNRATAVVGTARKPRRRRGRRNVGHGLLSLKAPPIERTPEAKVRGASSPERVAKDLASKWQTDRPVVR